MHAMLSRAHSWHIPKRSFGHNPTRNLWHTASPCHRGGPFGSSALGTSSRNAPIKASICAFIASFADILASGLGAKVSAPPSIPEVHTKRRIGLRGKLITWWRARR